MTCAACAARIEKKLNRLDGVEATVNYATEKATIVFDPDVVSTDELRAAVESIGYGAEVPTAGSTADDDDADERRRRSLLRRLIVAAGLGVPVLVMSMVPAAQFRGWQWVAFVLATPVATVGGRAVPPRRVEERPPGRGVDGHLGLGRSAGGLRVEHLCTVLHRCRRHRDEDADVAGTDAAATPTTCTSRWRRRQSP